MPVICSQSRVHLYTVAAPRRILEVSFAKHAVGCHLLIHSHVVYCTHGCYIQGPPPEKKRSKFCSQCGGPIEWGVPAGDHCWRHVCNACGFIDYYNPRMVRVDGGNARCGLPWGTPVRGGPGLNNARWSALLKDTVLSVQQLC